ncbi:MAG: hypothetical protein ACNS61_14140, partial [Candidatus Wenzhouxiangella sp. M2_3B_020]
FIRGPEAAPTGEEGDAGKSRGGRGETGFTELEFIRGPEAAPTGDENDPGKARGGRAKPIPWFEFHSRPGGRSYGSRD